MLTRPDAHQAQFRKWRRGSRQPAISGKQRSDRSRTERMWEPDRSQESKEIKRAKGGQKSQGAIEDKEDGGPGLFLHQILDFASVHFAVAPASAQPVF